MDPNKYTIAGVRYGCVSRAPGEIAGQQFIVENCEFTNIALFDFINTITIDDCNNCSIFVGPTTGRLVVELYLNLIVTEPMSVLSSEVVSIVGSCVAHNSSEPEIAEIAIYSCAVRHNRQSSPAMTCHSAAIPPIIMDY